MPIIPLITVSQYDRLKKLRADMINANLSDLAHVFVPLGAAPAGIEVPRLLFVGKATNGYNEPGLGSFAGSMATNTGLLRTHKLSQFLGFIRKITAELLQARGLSFDQGAVMRSIGWSNLVKIGVANGNPQGTKLQTQAKLSIEILKAEIARWKPHATIFLTSEYAADTVLLPAFGDRGTWTQQTAIASGTTEHVWFKTAAETGCPLIWTLHPQSQPAVHLEEMRAGVIARLL
jgi:hypothetical protein